MMNKNILVATVLFLISGALLSVLAQTEHQQQTPFMDESGHNHNIDEYLGSLDPGIFLDNQDKIQAFAQGGLFSDDDFWTLESNLAGTNSQVNGLAIHGDDLYVAGQFTEAGGVSVGYIARYDMINRTWHPLGSGTNTWIHAIAIGGDYLFVGGIFGTAGGSPAVRIARYNILDETWHPLGSGVSNTVTALYVNGTDLYVGGRFLEAGGHTVNRIARYDFNGTIDSADNARWSGIGGGINSHINHHVFAIIVHGDDMYVGGEFTEAEGAPGNRIARYNFTDEEWYPLGIGLNTWFASAFAIHGDDLYVGGAFWEAGGKSASRIARYDMNGVIDPLDNDRWHPLGSGVNVNVHNLLLSGTDLYVVGQFTVAGGKTAPRIARYDVSGIIDPLDNDRWHPLEGGLSSHVNDLVINGDDLYVGGSYTEAGGFLSRNITRYDLNTDTWHGLGDGFNARIRTFALDGDNMYVAGEFSHAWDVIATRIARYNFTDDTWHALGDGVNGTVHALALTDTDLYVGGDFTTAGGIPASRIARYNIGTGTWHALGDGMTGGAGTTVRAMLLDGNDLYIGGQFTHADGFAASRIVRYDITDNTWTALGAGVSSTVNAIALNGNNLFVGGAFSGVPFDRVARYDLGTNTWHDLGTGVDGEVLALETRKNDLYVGGIFTNAGGNPAARIARYNISAGTWHALGSGTNNWVHSLKIIGVNLYVGGQFITAGGDAANRIARYNFIEGTWHALGSGFSLPGSVVHAFSFHDKELYVGGHFTQAGGKPAAYLTRWSGPELLIELLDADLPGSNEGWRMLGAAIPGTTYSELLSTVWTQGFPGSNSNFGDLNVYYYDEENGWRSPSHANNIVGSNVSAGFDNAGHGVIVYVFADDDNDGTPDPWPKELYIFGIPHEGDIDLSLARADEGWHLLSNPYPFTISWGKLFGSLDPLDIHANVYVWDANRAGGANYRDSSIPLDPNDGWSGNIAPFQGFWVNALVDGADLGFRESHVWDDDPDDAYIYGDIEPILAGLTLTGGGMIAGSALIFDDEKALYPKTYNAYRLTSMAPQFLHLFTTNGTDDTAWRVQHLPRYGSYTKTLPLHVHSTVAGEFTLEAETMQGLEGIEILLTDNHTGQQMRLEPGFSYSFTMDATQTMQAEDVMSLDGRLPSSPVVTLTDDSPQARFSLTVNVSYTSTETENELPKEVRLSQNHPNPFNPTTQIGYALPEAADVRLEVFNIAGQRVATLVNGHQNAGWHSIVFDGSRLSSGVYLYRLQSGNVVQTRKMVLVK